MSVTLDKDEHMILEVRKHWYVMSTYGIIAFCLFLMPLLVYSIFEALSITVVMYGNTLGFFFFAYSAILLVTWMMLFYWWTDYFLDVWVVTNKKIIAIDQDGFFGRKITTLHLAKVQDVTSEVEGIIATTMDFGDITVETASHDGSFMIRGVGEPNKVREKINEVLAEYHRTHGQTE